MKLVSDCLAQCCRSTKKSMYFFQTCYAVDAISDEHTAAAIPETRPRVVIRWMMFAGVDALIMLASNRWLSSLRLHKRVRQHSHVTR